MSYYHFLLVFAIFFTPTTTTTASFPQIFPNASAIPPWLPNITAFAEVAAGPWQVFRNLSGCELGDNLDGLSKLKGYLREFGYITSSSNFDNFTNNFDDALEAALKTYQRNFNLNDTGRLDPPTIQQMIRPRCGVADIINGSSTMNSGKPPPHSASTGSIHSVAHYTFFPGTPRWRKRALTYAFLPGNQLSDSMKAVFSRAFDRWAAATTLTFSQAESYRAADINIGFFSGEHGDGEAFDGVLGTLAHAFSPPSGRLHLDGDEDWVIGSGGASPYAVDLESVAVHEIGHLLGLGHSSVEESIMFPTISSRTSKLELTTDDVQGIQQLYGSNPNNEGSSTTGTTTETSFPETNAAFRGGQRWRLPVLTAIGFLLLMLEIF